MRVLYADGIAAPFIMLRCRYHMSLDRIQMYVSPRLHKIGIVLHQAGNISSLEQMPFISMLLVIVHGIIMQKLLHDLTDLHIIGLKKQVKVIRHETVGMQYTFKFCENMFHDSHKHMIIAVIIKYLHPSYPTGHQMINSALVP